MNDKLNYNIMKLANEIILETKPLTQRNLTEKKELQHKNLAWYLL